MSALASAAQNLGAARAQMGLSLGWHIVFCDLTHLGNVERPIVGEVEMCFNTLVALVVDAHDIRFMRKRLLPIW